MYGKEVNKMHKKTDEGRKDYLVKKGYSRAILDEMSSEQLENVYKQCEKKVM